MTAEPGRAPAPELHYRYPGPHFFRDDPVDRMLFCGRPTEGPRLLNLVLAEALVVLYAKSGTGKTSLINATLLEPLRQKDFLPVVVRINDRSRRPSDAVFEAVRGAARTAKLELADGDPRSLLDYFRTLELWRGDVLITPVIILDQFEELFTIQGAEARQAFTLELAAVHGRDFGAGLTGPGDGAARPEDERRAPLKILISIREDALGELEELARQIPDILSNRFRLGPLADEEAIKAIVEPAALVNPRLATPPFEWDSDAVKSLITDLHKRRRIIGDADTAPYIEPFQLQLVCQHVERAVAARVKNRQPLTPILYGTDIGGDEGVQRIVRNFYDDQIAGLAKTFPLRRLTHLCENGLISRGGRRSTLDEQTILKEYHLTKPALDALVERHVLRAEPRGDEVRYEISHDTLLAPIANARLDRQVRRKRLVASALVAALALVGLVAAIVLQSAWYVNWQVQQEGGRLVEKLRGTRDTELLPWAASLAWLDEPGMADKTLDKVEDRAIRATGLSQTALVLATIGSREDPSASERFFTRALDMAGRVPDRRDRVGLLINIAEQAERIGRAKERDAVWTAIANATEGDARAVRLVAEYLTPPNSPSARLTAVQMAAVTASADRFVRQPQVNELTTDDDVVAAATLLLRLLPADHSHVGELLNILVDRVGATEAPGSRIQLAVTIAPTLHAHGRQADASRVLQSAEPEIEKLAAVEDTLVATADVAFSQQAFGRPGAGVLLAEKLLATVQKDVRLQGWQIASAAVHLSPPQLDPARSRHPRLEQIAAQLHLRAIEAARNQGPDALAQLLVESTRLGVRVNPTLWKPLIGAPYVDPTIVREGLWRIGERAQATSLARALPEQERAFALMELAHLSTPADRAPLIRESIALADKITDPTQRGALLADVVAWHVAESRVDEAVALVKSVPSQETRQPMLRELQPIVDSVPHARAIIALVAGLPPVVRSAAAPAPAPDAAKPGTQPVPAGQPQKGLPKDVTDAAALESSVRLSLLAAAINLKIRERADDGVSAELSMTIARAREIEAQADREEWLGYLGLLAARRGDVALARQLSAEIADDGRRLQIHAAMVAARAAGRRPELAERIFGNERQSGEKAAGRW